MRTISRTLRIATVVLAAASMSLLTAGTAAAQNEGRVSVGAGIDFTTQYYFRGIVQETGGFIAQPYLEAGIALVDGESASAALTAGTWHSMHSRTDEGFAGAPEILYETDFYAGLSLGFAGGVGADITYTSYMSPRGSWGTTNELAVGLSHDNLLAPYATFAFELSGGADGGPNEGSYLELGVEPSLPLDDAPVGVSFPVAVGMSLSDYYEYEAAPGAPVSGGFGFFSVGAMLGIPLSGVPAEWGSWEFAVGINLLVLSDDLQALNGSEDQVEPIGIFGLSLSY